MAVHLGGYSNNNPEILRTNDLRTLNFYLRALTHLVLPDRPSGTHTPTLYSDAPYTDLSFLKNEIKRITSHLNPQDIDQTLLTIKQDHFLPKSLFGWLEQNEEACMYVWLNNRTPSSSSFPWTQINTYTPVLPTSHEERLNCIIEFYDCSLIFNLPPPNPQIPYMLPPPKNKREHLEKLKNNWLNSRKNTKIPKWLNEKKGDPITWLWGYINDYNEKISFSQNPIGIPLYKHLITESEKKLGIIAALQSWHTNEDTKSLIADMSVSS